MPSGLECAPTRSWSNLSWENEYCILGLQHLRFLSVACGDTLVKQTFLRHAVDIHSSVDVWEKTVTVAFQP